VARRRSFVGFRPFFIGSHGFTLSFGLTRFFELG
jgi:hypothetical protein